MRCKRFLDSSFPRIITRYGKNEANDKSGEARRSENRRSFLARDFRKTVNLIFCPMLLPGHLLPVHEQRSEHFGVLSFQIFQIALLNAILLRRLRFDRSRTPSSFMDRRRIPSLYRAVRLETILRFPVRFNLQFLKLAHVNICDLHWGIFDRLFLR